MDSFQLLSKSYNEYVTKMNQAREAEAYAEAIEYARRAAAIAQQIAFARNVMPQVAQFYRSEFEKLSRYIQGGEKRRPAGGGEPPQQQQRTENAPAPVPAQKQEVLTLEEARARLNDLIGLKAAKAQIDSIINYETYCRLREHEGFHTTKLTRHMLFLGNPGTGKTTVARLIAQMFHALGILSKGHLIEVKRPDLVAEYEGQTAIKTKKIVEAALGGILFIDEAYTLKREGNDPFGQEAVDTLLPYLEDYRSDFIVIAAGYKEDMARFKVSNRGLLSRFGDEIEFEDYTEDELMQIFDMRCKKEQYVLSPEARVALLAFVKQIYENRTATFANARAMRLLFEHMVSAHSNRLARTLGTRTPSREELQTFLPVDVPTDFTKYSGADEEEGI